MSSGDEENRLRASLFIKFRTLWAVQKLNGRLERGIVNVQPEWLLAIRVRGLNIDNTDDTFFEGTNGDKSNGAHAPEFGSSMSLGAGKMPGHPRAYRAMSHDRQGTGMPR